MVADEIRQFIERYERLEAEKRDLAEAQKEVMAEVAHYTADADRRKAVLGQAKRA